MIKLIFILCYRLDIHTFYKLSEHSTLAHIKHDFIFQIRVNSAILYNLLKEEAILGSFKCIKQLENLHKRTREFFWDRLKWSIQRALRHTCLHHNELQITQIISLLSFIQNVSQFLIGSNFRAD